MNFFSSKPNNDMFDMKEYVESNPILIWAKGGKHSKDAIQLQYNKESGEYESTFKMPVLDSDGNEVTLKQDAIAKFSFTPLYCKLIGDVFTKYEWDLMDFNKTKAEELKLLLAKIEAL